MTSEHLCSTGEKTAGLGGVRVAVVPAREAVFAEGYSIAIVTSTFLVKATYLPFFK